MRSASVVNARPSKNSSGHTVHGAPHTRRVHSIARARAIVAWLPCMSSQQRWQVAFSRSLAKKCPAPPQKKNCTGGGHSGAHVVRTPLHHVGCMCTFTNAVLTWWVTGATTHPHRGGQDTLSTAPTFLVCQGSPEFIRTWLQHVDTDVARQPLQQPWLTPQLAAPRGRYGAFPKGILGALRAALTRQLTARWTPE